MKRLLLILFGGLTLSFAAQAASFDCGKATTKVENLVCITPGISTLDDRMGKTYQDVLSKATEEEKQRLITEQKHWLKYTRNLCSDETCFKHAYWSRLAELETFFAPHSLLYKKEADKAEAIKQILATSPLYQTAFSYPAEFCRQIFDDLKQMKDIHFVEPLVQAQSYEDAALDPWKRRCKGKEPLNFSYQVCGGNIQPDNMVREGGLKNCSVGYGLPPFKLFELPPLNPSGEKRYVFYSDSDYGPMNGGVPKVGGGYTAAGYKQIDINTCEIDRSGFESPALPNEPDGSNYSAIIEYQHQYYVLVLERPQHDAYWLSLVPGFPNQGCAWSPVKPKSLSPNQGSK